MESKYERWDAPFCSIIWNNLWIFNPWGGCLQQHQSQEQTHMPRQVWWFIFNLQIKNHGISYTRTHKLLYRYLLNTKSASLKHIIKYILEQPNVVSIAANESILAPLSKQTMWDRMPYNFPAMTYSSLAILSLACPNLAALQSLNSNIIKLTDTHHGKNNIRHSATLERHAFTIFFHISCLTWAQFDS